MPNPFVYLQAEGKYKVSVGKGEKLIMSKIDKFIESIPKQLKEAEGRREMLKRRISEINETLENLTDYADEIGDIRQKLDTVDLALGINDITINSRVLDN